MSRGPFCAGATTLQVPDTRVAATDRLSAHQQRSFYATLNELRKRASHGPLGALYALWPERSGAPPWINTGNARAEGSTGACIRAL